MKTKKDFKVIYAEVKPETHKTLEALCKKLDLPKTKVITIAINALNASTPKKC